MYIYIHIYIYIYITGHGARRGKHERGEETRDEETNELIRQIAALQAEARDLQQQLDARPHAQLLEEACRKAHNNEWEDSAGLGWGAAHMC